MKRIFLIKRQLAFLLFFAAAAGLGVREYIICELPRFAAWERRRGTWADYNREAIFTYAQSCRLFTAFRCE
jgi:hypothetical protein